MGGMGGGAEGGSLSCFAGISLPPSVAVVPLPGDDSTAFDIVDPQEYPPLPLPLPSLPSLRGIGEQSPAQSPAQSPVQSPAPDVIEVTLHDHMTPSQIKQLTKTRVMCMLREHSLPFKASEKKATLQDRLIVFLCESESR